MFEETLMSLLSWGMSKSPMFVSVFAVMGLARSINKILMPFLSQLVDLTETKKDNELLAKMLDSKAYKAISFLLDYSLSIKLPKKDA